jgi:hypothetical protein
MNRQWRTLYDTTVALLDDAMVDKKFWEHAFLPLVYVRNEVWSRESKCIAYHHVFGKSLYLSNLQVLRCPVFPHIDKSSQRKLSHKSQEGVFIGYALSYMACIQSLYSLHDEDW